MESNLAVIAILMGTVIGAEDAPKDTTIEILEEALKHLGKSNLEDTTRLLGLMALDNIKGTPNESLADFLMLIDSPEQFKDISDKCFNCSNQLISEELFMVASMVSSNLKADFEAVEAMFNG